VQLQSDLILVEKGSASHSPVIYKWKLLVCGEST